MPSFWDRMSELYGDPGAESQGAAAQSYGDILSRKLAEERAYSAEHPQSAADLGATMAGGFVGSSGPIRAYHGSPYKFDAFDLNRIGTGEGAQAYGHGLYFAESEDVARGYQNRLAPTQIEVNNTPHWNVSEAADSIAGKVKEGALPQVRFPVEYVIQQMRQGSNFESALAAMRQDYAHFKPENLAEAERLLREHSPKTVSSGHMYEVNLHADPNKFLDWDKPLKVQGDTGARAEDALLRILEEVPYLRKSADTTGYTGKQLYRAGQGAGINRALLQEEIPGIRYLDAMSRKPGEGTSNYVVFDPKIIEILRRYGLLPPAVGGAAAATSGAQPNANQ